MAVKVSDGVATKTMSLFRVEPDGDDAWTTYMHGEALNEAVVLHRLAACKSPHIVQV